MKEIEINTAESPEDVERIQNILKDRGYKADLRDCESLMRKHKFCLNKECECHSPNPLPNKETMERFDKKFPLDIGEHGSKIKAFINQELKNQRETIETALGYSLLHEDEKRALLAIKTLLKE